ncbi:hypothetical protein MA16_Dca024099 [Dendrobium catenatum]|uniref:Uncharacterized protein n=1 Tax=Dendrobium catenatum TaxID=906689 RepID=A0A2I0VA12_9ASPA|nr:hypothetical protein MA16_Dca024099 [Dendrobium catenatum]
MLCLAWYSTTLKRCDRGATESRDTWEAIADGAESAQISAEFEDLTGHVGYHIGLEAYGDKKHMVAPTHIQEKKMKRTNWKAFISLALFQLLGIAEANRSSIIVICIDWKTKKVLDVFRVAWKSKEGESFVVWLHGR